MTAQGVRVHIAGSAASSADRSLLEATHALVGTLTELLIKQGAGLVLGVGHEPLSEAGVPCTFDWTILEAISSMADPAPAWPGDETGRFWVVASQRAMERIPDSRRAVWDSCTRRRDFELSLTAPGWRMGGVIRATQVLRGDVLVIVGGGAGVEQLAQLYVDEGKPVIPIRCDLGAFSDDGNGGASYLHSRALGAPGTFFDLREGAGSATARLESLRVARASDSANVAEALMSLVSDLKPPRAFYVRLLDPESEDFDLVEAFFRNVVDPVMIERGYTPHEVGRDRPLAAFMNVEIFEGLHTAALVVADLTGVRPNCTMELGYALARRRRVIVSAMQGTRLPFDPDKLPTHFWSGDEANAKERGTFRAWLDGHLNMPPLVS
ncbi:MAG: hypothetical protein OXT70_03570 [Chloroflexota bacterium]|nr:hypothetical protein [Chloroflexota bacterium]